MGKIDKITLVTPIKGNHFDLSRHLEDFNSFVKKFPLSWELIWVCHNAQGLSIPSPANIELKFIENKKGRGPAVKHGLAQATGDIVCVFPMDWTVPLAEMFQFIQELVLHPEFDMVLGNRKTSKKKQISKKNNWHQTLENILLEKWGSGKSDPLCPYWAIRQEKLKMILPKMKMTSWYYTPEVLQAAELEQFKIVEVPILSQDQKESQIPIWREFLRQLFDSPKAQ
jgi:hypothetical protein